MSNVVLGSWQITFSDDIFTLIGKSTYTKPTPDRNDELFRGKPLFIYQIDNTKVFAYDYDTSTWIEQQ